MSVNRCFQVLSIQTRQLICLCLQFGQDTATMVVNSCEYKMEIGLTEDANRKGHVEELCQTST